MSWFDAVDKLRKQQKAVKPTKRLWLDDTRPAPKGWTRVRTVDEAKAAMTREQFDHVSLDHDLGAHTEDGHALVEWMAETNTWPKRRPHVHSGNPEGRDRMLKLLFEKYPKNG